MMDYNKALQKCMHLCSRNEYCKFDIKKKLKKWELNYSEVDNIIDYLEDNNYLDEERYTRAFVNDKFKFNRWGKVKIAYHLKHKTVANETIKLALASINEEEYCEICKQEIEKKRPKVKAESNYERNGKIAQYVISKGFEPDLVFKLMDGKSND